MPKIPIYSASYTKSLVTKRKVQNKFKKQRLFTHEDRVIIDRLTVINKQIYELKAEKKELSEIIKKRKQLALQNRLVPVKLYALKLEDSCWYIGMSYNVDKRFIKHSKGKGSGWTRLHKPIEIFEVRTTEYYDQDNASKLEDDMTLEYALKYSSVFVRGGGWCQQKPLWPDIIKQNEINNPPRSP